MPDLAPEVRALVSRIRQYILTRSQAADSVKGVAGAWLELSGEEAWLPVVEQALEHLVATGEMQRQRLADGTVMYSVATRIRH
ncbi:MAG TPA: hypothetical protein VD791_05030 [Burkholderiales bacterium]|nr:hypothetical protein [Burkholderiales bacterium]